MPSISDTLPRLQSALAGLTPNGINCEPRSNDLPLRPGAVLALIYPIGPTPRIVLTLRPSHLLRHAGQICLPGGRYDPSDRTLLNTALRETEEELGVPASAVQVWGRLEDTIVTVSQYRITPFVGFCPSRPTFQAAPSEVAEVLEVPLDTLIDSASLQVEVRELQGMTRSISFYPFGPHKIWGATARVLGQLGAILSANAPRPIEI